jgi:hypothetical protein
VKASLLAAGLLLALGGTSHAATRPESLELGTHWRVGTPNGIVHVWRPDAYDAATAGTVVYVHGYYASADTAWSDDRLARQFRQSGANALFVVPEAPSSGEDEVVWPSLAALLDTVRGDTGQTVPAGPLVVVGHSGAVRTIERWLADRRVSHVILLDAVYGNVTPFRTWLVRGHGGPGRLIVVAGDTLPKATGMVRGLWGVARLSRVPEDGSSFSHSVRQSRVILMRSQYEHMAMISDGRVIPVVLGLTSLHGSHQTAAHGRQLHTARPAASHASATKRPISKRP